MKLMKVVFMVLILSSLLSAQEVKVPDGTVVVVKNTERLSGKMLEVGQQLTFIVASDVVVDNHVIIKSGSTVVGVVDKAKGAQMVGAPGNIVVTLQTVKSVTGRDIPLTGQFKADGESEMGATVAVSVILCPLALLNRGKEAVIPAGAQVRAFTAGNITLTL